MGKRTFTVEWDRKIRGAGEAGEGVPQGSPLSPILFLIFLVPTIHKMERELRRAILELQIEVYSYVDDLALLTVDIQGTFNMERMVMKGGEIMSRIVREDGILLEKSKEETIIFGKKGRKGETVK